MAFVLGPFLKTLLVSGKDLTVQVGTNIIHVPVDFLQGPLSHIQIYTRLSAEARSILFLLLPSEVLLVA